ncbi:hypothetical protein PHLGIDRAFT_118101 [Phlebiopsis gigantea 11061_1 CR5-6]|uniref:Xylanolytic transcriptional activator regulatory domain-containing protein n=1 Tax=Phlebiopsis gigantea (strain 11061_1 CR5-6) TaxID=745531 RepID=A0A0C3S8H4_PHLG1|nr:hypothetical protein PHLGIDRAFT_118101 [Phlebiopsis gigantea 11061_1 CR5-6]
MLEQNVEHLEARIRALEGDAASVTLHNPHAISQANQPAGQTSGSANQRLTASQKIMQAFIEFGPDFGFFLHMPRFLNQLRASIPPTDQSPLPPALVHAVQLIGLLFTGDNTLQQQEPRKLALLIEALSADLDPSQILYTLQAEVLVSYYFFHRNRRLEGSYHAAAAVSIAVACKLHKIRSASWMIQPPSTPSGQEVRLFPPADDVEEGERIRAFWTVFSLDRCWAVWTQSPSVFMTQPSAQVDTPWPLEMSEYEQHLMMPQGSTSALTVRNFLDGLTTEMPDQSLLSMRSKAAVLFEQAYRLVEEWNPTSLAFQNQFHALNARIEQFKALFSFLNDPPHQTSTHRKRGLLLTRTLLCCATIQLYSRTEPRWDREGCEPLQAAITAANAIEDANVPVIEYVDPVLGMLWALVGQTFVTALTALRGASGSSLSPTLSVPPGEIVVLTAMNRVLAAMDALKDTSLLIADELAKLRSSIAAQPLVVM